MNSVHFQGKPFSITIIQVYVPQSNAQNSPSQASAIRERELPDVQGGFRKGRGTRDQIANISDRRWQE